MLLAHSTCKNKQSQNSIWYNNYELKHFKDIGNNFLQTKLIEILNNKLWIKHIRNIFIFISPVSKYIV